MDSAIRTRDLRKVYSSAPPAANGRTGAGPFARKRDKEPKPRITALDGINLDVALDVAPGQIFGMLGPNGAGKALLARERLRKGYRPDRVRMLFVGESPPASGRFFYQANSGLYRAMRDTFIAALPALKGADFLSSFKDLGCYLVDLCGVPVDRLPREQRRKACVDGEPRLGGIIRRRQPKIIVTVVRSIAPNVARSQRLAKWRGVYLELPYPGRWQTHRVEFRRALVPLLRTEFAKKLVS